MKLYLGTLDRYGYDLTVMCVSAEECEEKLIKEYERVFEMYNPGEDPKKEIAGERYSDLTFYEQAREEIEIEEFELGKVEWR